MQECQSICFYHADCQFFTYTNPGGMCDLHTAANLVSETGLTEAYGGPKECECRRGMLLSLV